jgi:hypothetical protein
MGEEARWSQDRCGAHGREKATRVEEKATEEDEGNGVNPTLSRPIYRGVHRIYQLQFLLPYNAPQRLYPREVREKIKAEFSLSKS